MVPFDRVVLSSTEDWFLEFWPLVSTAWRRFFPDVKVSLALVRSDVSDEDGMLSWAAEYGDTHLFPLDVTVPAPNYAKLARYLLAARFPDEVCLIHDVDTCPLQRKYYINLVKPRRPHHLLCVGAEVYRGTPHEGKFPAGCVTGEGRLFGQLINPSEVPEDQAIGAWSGLRIFDAKEDPCNAPDRFSDESLMRALLSRNQDVKPHHVVRGIDIHRDWVDRSWWSLDEEKLHRGGYIEANLLRPMSDNWKAINPIARFIFGKPVDIEEITFARGACPLPAVSTRGNTA